MADQTPDAPEQPTPAPANATPAPAPSAFDVLGAQRAGYSKAEIADYLAQKSSFNASGARDAGYSDADIIDYLTPAAETQSSISKTMPMPTEAQQPDKSFVERAEDVGNAVNKGLALGPQIGSGAVKGAGEALVEAHEHPEEVLPSDEFKDFLGKIGLAPTEQNQNLLNRATWAFAKAGVTGMNLIGTAIMGAVHGGAEGAAKALTGAGMEPQSAQDLARDIGGGVEIELQRGGEVPAVARLHGTVKEALGDNLRSATAEAPKVAPEATPEEVAAPVMAAGNLDDAIKAAGDEAGAPVAAPDIAVSETAPEGEENAPLWAKGQTPAEPEVPPEEAKPDRFAIAAQHLENAAKTLRGEDTVPVETPEEAASTPTESAQEGQPATAEADGATETPPEGETPAVAPENTPETSLSPEDEARLRAEPLALQDRQIGTEAEHTPIAGGSFARRADGDAQETAPPFFSALTKTVESAKQDKATPGQWLAQIKNTPGVKGEELQWSGVEDFLNNQTKSVSKADLLDFLHDNEVKVQEVTHGDMSGALNPDEQSELSAIRARDWQSRTPSERDRMHALEDKLAKASLPPKFGPGSGAGAPLPGGIPDSYRELLLTLPHVDPTEARRAVQREMREMRRAGGDEVEGTPAYRRLQEEWNRLETTPDQAFRSSHWDEPNVLAHVRFDDRTGPNGEKILHVAEIQSDWHQAGRKRGYQGDTDPSGGIVANGVPNAPFKSTWHELALKRMLRYAAEKGYDRLSWDTGETNAARYDLSKHIDAIHYRENDGDGTFTVSADNAQQQIWHSARATPEMIADHLGKEIADKITGGEGEEKTALIGAAKRKYRTLSGLDLKVGGEGMKGFYDKILPQFANKYVKKWGAKVEDMRLGAGPDVYQEGPGGFWRVRGDSRRFGSEDMALDNVRERTPEKSVPVHSIPITDSMRESVLQKGQPMFAQRAQAEPTLVQHEEARLSFTPEFASQREALSTRLQDELNQRGLGHVAARVADQILTPDGALADGHYYAKVIHIALDAQNPLAMLDHEVVHALFDMGLFTKSEQSILEAKARSQWTQQYAHKLEGYPDANKIEESIARRAEDVGREAPASAFTQRMFQKVRDFFEAVGNAFRGLGFDTADKILARTKTDAFGKRLAAQGEQGGSFGRRTITGAGKETEQYTPEQLRAYENVGRITDNPSWSDRWQAAKADIGRRLIRATLDPYIGLKSYDPIAYLATRIANTSAGATEQFLTDGLLKFKGAAYAMLKRDGGVQKLIHGLQGEETRFIWWVAAHRAEQLSSEDRENLWNPDDIKAIKGTNQGALGFDYQLSNGRTTRSREAAYMDSLGKLDEMNRNLLGLAVQAGLTKREAASALLRNPFYVPFYRIADQADLTNPFSRASGHFAGPTSSSGFTKQYAFKQLTGGEAKLHNDLWTNYIRNASHIIDSAARNRAAVFALDAGRKAGAVKLLTEKEFDLLSRADKKNATWVMVNGQKMYAHVLDPMLHTAISALEFTGYNHPIMKGLGWFKQVLTQTVTVNPVFALRVAVKDAIQAVATSPLGYNLPGNIVQGFRMNDLPGAMNNVARAVAGQEIKHLHMSDEAADAVAGGALMRLGAGHDSGIRKTSLQAMGGVLDTPDKIAGFWNYLSTVARAYKEVTAQGEDVQRLALYHKLIAEGVPHDQAVFAGRDLEDFTLKGASTVVRALTQTVPFMNAWMQGLYKVGRSAANADKSVTTAIAGNAAKRVTIVLAATTMLTLALDQIYKNDEDYKKRTDYDRDSNFWFKFGNTQIRVPMGFEVSALARIAANGAEGIFGQNEMTARRFANSLESILGQNLSMNPVPQAFRPILDIMENQSAAGVPIETKGMENLQPEDRYTAATSLPARWVSEAGAPVARAIAGQQAGFLSPVQIDYLINGYFAWLGTMITAVADRTARQFSDEPARPTRDLFSVATGGLVQTEPSAQSYYIDQLYQQGDGIDKAFGTYNDLIRRGRGEDAQAFAAANPDAIGRHGLVTDLSAMETSINSDIRLIENSRDRTPQEKHDAIAALNAQRNQVAEQVFGAHQ